MLEWNPLPINLEATIIKLSIDLCLFFRHFHEQIILKINNKALTESYEGFFNTLITGFQIYTSSKAEIETIKNMIENFNRAPEIQSEQKKNFALIAAIIHDLNTTFSNIAFILNQQAFEFRPNPDLAIGALIIELDQAQNDLIPQLNILNKQSANFIKYLFELHYLHQQLLMK